MTDREKLIELIVSADISLFGTDKPYAGAYADYILADEEIKHAFELLKVEKEGRLIETPCKVGTRVYRIVPDHLVTYPDPAEYTIIWDTFKLNDIYTFGKTVFLSREAAEKALKADTPTDKDINVRSKGGGVMSKKMFIQCSNCGFHFEARPMLGIPEGMYYGGYRAVGSALYCPDCVKTWKDRNGAEFDEQYKNPSKMFATWWNNKVQDFVEDKSRIKTYRIVNGIYEDVKGGEG